MGVDLTVCPVQYKTDTWWLLYNRLRFGGCYELFERLGMDGKPPVVTLEGIPPAAVVQWYQESGVRTITKDACGEALKWCRAGDFNKVPYGDYGVWNGAILAMLCALPPDTPVVLYWH